MSTLKTNRIENLTTTDGGISINNSGQVGIGTTTPSEELEISSATPTLKLSDTDEANSYGTVSMANGDMYLQGNGASSNGKFIFRSGNAGTFTERMRIDSSGVVKLTQSGNNPRYGSLEASGDAFKLKAFSGDASHNATMQFFTGADSPEERMRIDSSGRMGINTNSPAATLSVNALAGNSTVCFLQSPTSNAYLQLANSSNSQGYLGYQSSNMTFYTDGSERMRLDSSGRVGIANTTPGNLDPGADDLVVGSGSGDNGLTIYSGSSNLGNLYFADGIAGSDVYTGGINYDHSTNSLAIFTNGGQTRMRFDNAGKVGIGTNTLVARLNVYGAESATLYQNANTGQGSGNGGFVGNWGGNPLYVWNYESSTVEFGTANTERARITSGGFFMASSSGSFYGTLGSPNFHSFDSASGQWTFGIRNSHASQPFGLNINYSAVTPNGTSNQFLYCSDTTSLKLSIKSNGGVENYQSNNTNLCDEREKKNIETLDSTWGCLKNWELKKFHYNEDADTDDKRYGVIAQQVEQHCPEVITDWTKQRAEDAVLDEDGNVVTPAKEEILRKGVKEQQMMWMAIKALQEAQDRIETLEAEVAALKSN